MHEKGTLVAVVLAGGGEGDRLARATGAPSKAHVPLGEKPLGEYVLDALRSSGSVGPIVLVGEPRGSFGGLFDVSVPAGERLVDSLALGLGAAMAQPGVDAALLVTADIPWLTGAAVSRFVSAAQGLVGADGRPAGLVYPIVSEAAATAQFPDQRRTYAALGDGRFTGGNLVFLRRAAVPALLPLMDRAYRDRKNPFALARLVGPGVLARFLLGRASLGLLERRVSALLGAPARALVSEDACLAADVDVPDHLTTAPPARAPATPAPFTAVTATAAPGAGAAATAPVAPTASAVGGAGRREP